VRQRSLFLLTCLLFGYAFFYIPILSMIFFSFNKSRLATVWGGFSTEWYGRLLANDQVIAAALLSLKIALISATLATLLGTMAAWRSPAFAASTAGPCSRAWCRRRSSCRGHHRPLDAPALRLYGTADRLAEWPRRHTVTIAHTTFPCPMSPSSCARGWSPWTSRSKRRRWISAQARLVLFDITLPLIAPA
jgi:putrescine transport system permease protein